MGGVAHAVPLMAEKEAQPGRRGNAGHRALARVPRLDRPLPQGAPHPAAQAGPLRNQCRKRGPRTRQWSTREGSTDHTLRGRKASWRRRCLSQTFEKERDSAVKS